MRNSLKIIILLISFSSTSLASDMLVDANILYTAPNASGNDDFHTGKIININYNYYYLPWLAFSGGIFFSEEIFDDINTDIVGTYQASIKTSGLTLGIRPEYKFSLRNKVYARLALLSYNTKLTVDEYFEPGLPVGSSSDNTSGNGYIFSLGWNHSFTETVSFQLELHNQTQLILFDGDTASENVFDLTNAGFSLGLGYAF